MPWLLDDLHNGAVEQLKDGSLKHTCPMHHCKSTSFKLRRHLQTQHSDLTVDQVDYAIRMSGVMTRNRQGNRTNVISLGRSRGNISTKSNSMVSRKENYKRCIICSKLVINLSDHVRNTHKIKSDDAMYSFYVKEPPVVPACYTKLELSLIHI